MEVKYLFPFLMKAGFRSLGALRSPEESRRILRVTQACQEMADISTTMESKIRGWMRAPIWEICKFMITRGLIISKVFATNYSYFGMKHHYSGMRCRLPAKPHFIFVAISFISR